MRICVKSPIMWLLLLGMSAPVCGDQVEYNRDIRPILTETCFSCHGPDSASRKADLRLDQRDAAVSAGALVPGSPDNSEVIRRILSENPEEVMPPPAMKKSLTSAQKELLAEWIRSGAEYQPHWSFLPPVAVEIPKVAAAVAGFRSHWSKNPIDGFILEKLDTAGLIPAEEADRRVLARRAALDITGLPPSATLLQEFLQDSSPDAYERYVDRLLQMPEWGEHRGRYWLDYARYADTHGVHFDNYREMWAYRDWVIKAFNRNMPFDQFTIENLAGDLLPNATLDQKIASGFNRCNMTTNEGGIIDEEYAVLYTRDRTETVSAVWLGLTAGCATCHNHKFDPISQQEFYQLAAFFNNTTQPVRDGNVRDTPPIIVVPMESDRTRFEELPSLIATSEQAVETRHKVATGDFQQWLSTATPDSLGEAVSKDGLVLHTLMQSSQGRQLQVEVNGVESRELPLADTAQWNEEAGNRFLTVQGAACRVPDVGDFASNQPFSCAMWIKAPASDGSGSLCARMDAGPNYQGWDFWIQQRRIGMHLVSQWPDKALKVVSRPQIPANEWVHVAIAYDGSRTAAGLQIFFNGKLQEKNIENDRLGDAPIQTSVPWTLGARSVSDPFTGAIRDLMMHNRALSAAELESLASRSRFEATLAKRSVERTEAELKDLYEFWLKRFDTQWQTLAANRDGLQRETAEIQTRGTIAHVMNERSEPATAYILTRGEYDKRGAQVNAGTPAILPALPADAPHNRLGFARWLVGPKHPLTARVTVNRYWQEVFGTGLVQTTGDFGVSGDLPINQKLLDWLAVDFQTNGWDVKRLIRLMVTSAAYRQAAVTTPEKLEKDPANRLLSRGPRFRMDAEMVRDYALATSGLLVRKLGGPSVKPYQPEGVWEAIAMDVSNTRSYVRDSGDNLYRRSLYTFVKRMAPPASLDLFNAPNRELCVVRRERTNTPLQALVTMNDEQFIEAARRLAERALTSDATTDSDRLQWLSEQLLCRQFRPEELAVLTASLANLRTFYGTHTEEARQLIDLGDSEPAANLVPGELAAWTMLNNELMNLDEVLIK